jgi:parvulin-like peptidyl-prolyl isomerase
LLDKRIQDILFIQDALAADMDQEPAFVRKSQRRTRTFMIQEYVKDNLELPTEADPADVMAFFQNNYGRVQLRQLSVRTAGEAARLREAVLAGADMESLARQFSLDTKRFNGGLHNSLHWIDVPAALRSPADGLEVGRCTEVFPINDAWSFLRVEARAPADDVELSRFEKNINAILVGIRRQEVWKAFAREIQDRYPIQESMAVLQSVLQDSMSVMLEVFKRNQPEFAFQLTADEGVTGTEFREELAYSYKSDTSKPFRTHFKETRELLINQLVLAMEAHSLGYTQNPAVQERLDRDWEERLLRAYVDEVIGSGVEILEEEVAAFHAEKKDMFRGPDEVRLDILILQDQELAEEAARRLKEGADFGRIYSEYSNGRELSPTKPKFIKETELSEDIRQELDRLEPGQTSTPQTMGMGYMIFRLDARRPGAVAPLAEAAAQIRKHLFKKKFQERVQENFQFLRENSKVVVDEERLAAYYVAGSG